MIKGLNKVKMITGGLVTIFFLIHVVLMALLLEGWIPYSSSLKYTGITLVVTMVMHIIVCVVSVICRQEHEKKFYRLKWMTGILILLIMTVHGNDYVKEVNWLCFHLNKGIVVACIEIMFLILCTLHIRISVDAICNHFGIEENKKLIWGRISCAIATLIILLPGIAIWHYFL